MYLVPCVELILIISRADEDQSSRFHFYQNCRHQHSRCGGVESGGLQGSRRVYYGRVGIHIGTQTVTCNHGDLGRPRTMVHMLSLCFSLRADLSPSTMPGVQRC